MSDMDIVSLKRKALKRKRYSAAGATAKQAPGLQRYLKLRGTPAGVYEIVRTATGNLPIVNSGWNNGTVTWQASCIAFYPEYVAMFDPTGATILYSMTIPNYAEIAALFDNVKIDKVEIEIHGCYASAQNSSNGQVIPLLGGFDNNDRTCSLDQIKQIQNKTIAANTYTGFFKTTVRPTYNTLVYYTAATSGFKPERGYFRSDYNIEHLGFKIAIDDSSLSPSTSDPLGRMSMVFRYHLKCKNLK